MKAIVKLDAGLVNRGLGLKMDHGGWKILPGFGGITLEANETPADEPMIPNTKQEFTYGPLKVGPFGATFQLNPDLAAYADVIGPSFLSPGFQGTVTVRIRAVKMTPLKDFGVQATLHLVD